MEDKSGQKQQKKSTPETRRLAAAIVGSCISRSSHGTEWGLSLNRMKLVPALQGFVNREAFGSSLAGPPILSDRELCRFLIVSPLV